MGFSCLTVCSLLALAVVGQILTICLFFEFDCLVVLCFLVSDMGLVFVCM